MICSACGHENQTGKRFCRICGIPFPLRPLTAPGAHGTHTLTSFPLENGKPGRGVTSPTQDEAKGSASQIRNGALTEMPALESVDNAVQQSANLKRPGEMVPEVPLDEYVKSFRYVPPSDLARHAFRKTTLWATPHCCVGCGCTPR